MKKKLFELRIFFILLLCFSFAGKNTYATHIYGADFFYTHVSGNTYTITLVIYGDCAGTWTSGPFTSLPNATPGVDIFNGNSLYTSTSLTIQSPSAGVEVTPVCPSQLNSTICKTPNTTLPGVKKFTYSRTITLNTTSANWKFIFNGQMGNSQAGRSSNITNIGGAGSSLMNLEATLNNVNAPNSSPVYTTIPTPFFCVNTSASYNPGAVDPNTDSLAYALTAGLQPGVSANAPIPITYATGYSATAPIAVATGTFSFSNTNGQLNFKPNAVQSSLVVNRVSEYRNGVLVGTSMREMTFVVLNNCNNRPPLGSVSNATGGTTIDSTTVTVCKSTGILTFKINPSDSDGNAINVTWSGIPAGASFNVTNNNTTAPQGTFSWNVSSVNPGTYNFFVTYVDDGCPISSKQTLAYTVIVLPAPTISYALTAPATCTKKAKFNITPALGSPWILTVSQGSTLVHSIPNITGTQADSLSPGTYNLRLTNVNGCFRDTLITVQPPPAIVPSVSMTQPSCNGYSDGSITLTGSGGATPFKYAIGSGAYGTGNTFTNLTAGTYVLHIMDNNDCEKDTTVQLSQPIALTAGVTFKQPPCNYYNSGVITLNASNGTSPYQYAINTGSFSTNNTFSGLYSGSYTLHIKDAKGCIKDSVFKLPDSVTVHANALVTNVLCNGNSTGAITLNAFGTIATPYLYKIGSGTLGSNNTFTGLAAGTYNFHIEDTNKCYLDTAVTLTEPAVLRINPVVSNALCFGNSDGIITNSATGGVAPYTYALGAGPYASGNIFSSLAAGTYIVRVKDANNCTDDSSVSILHPAKISITNITPVTPNCFGAANGSISLSGAGGTSPYSYALNTGGYQGSNVFTSLTAGAYALHLRDANNCQADTNITLSQPTPIIPTAVRKNSTCNPLNNGAVTLGATGGVPLYTYAAGTGTYTTSPVFSSLAANTYTFHIKDSRDCIKDTVITITDSLIVAGITNVTNTTCFNDSNGSISIVPSGGVTPYAYSIAAKPYQSSSLFTNLKAGTHNIVIKDNLGCTDTLAAVVGEPSAIRPNATIQHVSCFGNADGTISFAPSGGTAPYTYAMGTGAYSNNNIITNVQVGQYLYHVKDNKGCVVDTLLLVKEPPVLSISVAVSNNLCFGDTSGRVTVTVTGGTPSYKYYANSNPPQASNVLSGLAAGPHVIYVQDTNLCKISKVVNLTQPARLYIDKITITNPTCDGFTDGSVKMTAKGGTTPYEYAINEEPYGLQAEFKQLEEGNYTLKVKDANNCQDDTAITLLGLKDIVIDEIITDNVKCFGGRDGKITVNVSGGVPPLKYRFNSNAPGDSNIFSTAYAGRYSITVTDSMNCKVDTSAEIGTPSEMKLVTTAIPNDCEGYDDDGRVKIDVTGGISPYSFYWNTSPPSTSQELWGLKNDKYIVIVTDANECTDTAIADITYDNCCKIVIPDAFTPNNDGKNDMARVIVKGSFKLRTFAIFNRFGQKVFHTDVTEGNYSDGWDGKLNGVTQDLGTYNYYVTGTCGNTEPKEVEYKGTIILLR